jgi:hypothetical protein
MPKLTEKEKKEKAKAAKEAKVRKIIVEAIFPAVAHDALDAIYMDYSAASIKSAKKELAKQMKVLDKAIAVLCPPKA